MRTCVLQSGVPGATSGFSVIHQRLTTNKATTNKATTNRKQQPTNQQTNKPTNQQPTNQQTNKPNQQTNNHNKQQQTFLFAGSGCLLCVAVFLLLFFLACLFSSFLVFCFPELLCQSPRRSEKIPPRSGKKYRKRKKYLLARKNIFFEAGKFFQMREKYFLPKREQSLRNGKIPRKREKNRKRKKYQVEVEKVPEAGKIPFGIGKNPRPNDQVTWTIWHSSKKNCWQEARYVLGRRLDDSKCDRDCRTPWFPCWNKLPMYCSPASFVEKRFFSHLPVGQDDPVSKIHQ